METELSSGTSDSPQTGMANMLRNSSRVVSYVKRYCSAYLASNTMPFFTARNGGISSSLSNRNGIIADALRNPPTTLSLMGSLSQRIKGNR